MSKLELLKTVYKSLGFSNNPLLGWTVIGLSAVLFFIFLAMGWFEDPEGIYEWIRKNIALLAIILFAVCIGIGSYRNLRKAIKDQQKQIETLRKKAEDQQEQIKTLCGDGDKDE